MIFEDVGRLLRSEQLRNVMTFCGIVIVPALLVICFLCLCWSIDNVVGRFVVIGIALILITIPIYNNSCIVGREQNYDFLVGAIVINVLLDSFIDLFFYKLKKR